MSLLLFLSKSVYPAVGLKNLIIVKYFVNFVLFRLSCFNQGFFSFFFSVGHPLQFNDGRRLHKVWLQFKLTWSRLCKNTMFKLVKSYDQAGLQLNLQCLYVHIFYIPYIHGLEIKATIFFWQHWQFTKKQGSIKNGSGWYWVLLDVGILRIKYLKKVDYNIVLDVFITCQKL